MLAIAQLFSRIKFWRNTDRIGPDIPWSHWRLHFPVLMRELCLRKFCHFGELAEFRPGAYAIGCSRISLGRRVIIRPASMLFAESSSESCGITIEDNVMLGGGVHIYVENHRFDMPKVALIDQGYSEARSVCLRNGCWIGANVIILPGVEVGAGAVVGAGSIVTKSIPARVVAVGNPARVIKVLCSGEGET